ncbi:hypothetical protein [Calothrix sp. NIES-3974]|uniref:hypothetical protein n=1 Tax=Calothrix sp. NIES-3974 TaxID=2005462 RepID=UPI000B5F9676|nr:hypothetical protein [Calothrix sp. NIES-3974]BAZ04059.1 hypothetical protein NIES3974_06890 [Calothrix sp. NIES-3974]
MNVSLKETLLYKGLFLSILSEVQVGLLYLFTILYQLGCRDRTQAALWACQNLYLN